MQEPVVACGPLPRTGRNPIVNGQGSRQAWGAQGRLHAWGPLPVGPCFLGHHPSSEAVLDPLTREAEWLQVQGQNGSCSSQAGF